MIEKLKKYQHAINNKQQTSFQIRKIFKSIKWTDIPSTTNRNMLLNFSEKPVSFSKCQKRKCAIIFKPLIYTKKNNANF